MLKCIERIKPVIPSWYTRHSHIMHRPENSIRANHCHPEVYPSHRLIHKSSVHAREPVIHTCKHSKECCNTHYNMKMRNDEIRIVQLNVNSGIAQEDPGQTS